MLHHKRARFSQKLPIAVKVRLISDFDGKYFKISEILTCTRKNDIAEVIRSNILLNNNELNKLFIN